MAIDLLADEPEGIDLLADEPKGVDLLAKSPSYYDLSKENQGKAMTLARQQIAAKYPNIPTWLQNMMLSVTPKDESPRLRQVANQAQAQSNFIPVTLGGLSQGFAMPLQGISSLIPGKAAKEFTDTDFTSYFPGPQNPDEEVLQFASKVGGSLGPLGKIFGGLKSAAQMASVPKALQNAGALAGTGAIATPGDSGDKSLGALGALALGGAGKLAERTGKAVATKIPAFLRGLTNDSTTKSLTEAVQRPHDILNNTVKQLYGYVRDSIKKRGVSIPVKPEYIYKAEDLLPNTRASKKLIYDAKTGDYEAIHDLQSQLYKKGTKGLMSDDIAIQNQADEILDLRNNINDDLHDHLMKSGNVDIAHVLKQGKNLHKQLMDTYFDRNLPKSIGKMVHPELRLVPENPENMFNENSVPMKTFLKKHPEVSQHVQGIKEKEAAKRALGDIFKKSATIGGSAYLGKSIYDLLK